MANIYLNAKKDLTTATVTTLYTVPNNSRSIIKSILVNEKTNAATTLTLILYDGDPATATAFNLYTTVDITALETKELLAEPLVMMENEVLQVTAADANRCTIVASILETNREDK